MFKDNEIKKTYWAVVKSITKKKSDKLENYLIKNQKQNKSYVAKVSKYKK